MLTAIKPAGTIDSMEKTLIMPEVLDETKWLNGRIPFIDKEKEEFYLGQTEMRELAKEIFGPLVR